MMKMKNVMGAVALLGVALWTGCATGGGGHTGGNITVKLTTANNQNIVGVTLTLQLTATVSNTDNKAVTWALTQSGVDCSPTCGMLSSSGLYAAPAAPPKPTKVDITATSVANTQASATFTITVFPITPTVTPGPASVGVGLQQQFAAPVTPDTAPQTVTWQPLSGTLCPADDCGTLNSSGVYSAPGAIPSGGPFFVSAISTVDPPNWIGTATVTVVTSRLSGHYAFQFSGYDTSNHPIALAGAFVANSNNTIQGGTLDELTSAGHNRCTILSSSSYAFANSNGSSHNSNDHGSLTLKTTSGACSVNARTFNFVLRTDGNGQMIEFDSVGRGSGKLSLASGTFNNNLLSGGFAFGLSGADIVSGKRAGSAGFFVADGAGNIGSPPGLFDINDGGVITSSSHVTGSYSIASDGTGSMTLVDNDHGGATYQFALYVVGGKAGNATNPLTLYVIATDPLSNHPAVVGTIVAQDKMQAFDKSALNDFVVTNLTGVDSTGMHAQVSLTTAKGDGNGNISASYDANNAGTIVAAKTFTSTYSATGTSPVGRYTVDWLSPAVHFVLYLNAANRGFMLEIDNKTSNEVYTGSMDPQPAGGLSTSEMVGTLDAATVSSGSPNASPVAINLFNSFGTLTTFTVAGAQDETGQSAGQSLVGTGTFDATTTTGKITLTQPAATTYVYYPIDNPKPSFLILHFEMIDVTAGQKDATIIFGER